MFCRAMGCTLVPPTTDILCKYAAMLVRSLKYNRVMHYLNIIRILHLEWDLPDPLLDNFRLRCVMQGIRRDVGDFVCRKLPMTPCLLRQVLSQLDLSRPLDILVWAACLVLFYTTLRRSNLLPSHLLQFVSPAVISIGLISRFTPEESA